MQHNNHASPSRAGSSSGHGRSPAPRAVPGLPKRQVETIDEEADEDEDESAGLLNSGWQRQRPGYTASLVLQRWPWLVLSLCVVVGTIYTLRSPTRTDTTQHSPTLGAHAVQELEAAIQKQREQLLSLQSRLAAGGGKLRICSVGDQVWGVILVTGLDKLFEFHDDLAIAIASLQLDG